MEDFLRGVEYLAAKRARMLNRETRSMDYLHMIFICGACPWPRNYAADYMERLGRLREYIFTGAAAGNFERLDAAIPNATLLFLTERVYELHAQLDLAGIFRIPAGAGTGYEQG
jgi:hypothetical protein